MWGRGGNKGATKGEKKETKGEQWGNKGGMSGMAKFCLARQYISEMTHPGDATEGKFSLAASCIRSTDRDAWHATKKKRNHNLNI